MFYKGGNSFVNMLQQKAYGNIVAATNANDQSVLILPVF